MRIRTNFLIMLTSAVLSPGCVDNDLKEKARLKSDEVMNNLGNSDSYRHFSEKYFPKDKMISLLEDLKTNCDFENRNGRYIDYFYESTPGADKISFIYEYDLKCDSLRFLLGYKLEYEPELISFKIEPIETENKMLVDKSKQLTIDL